MALETITLNAGSGGVTVPADQVGSDFYPVGLVAFGPDGGPHALVTTSNGLPVQPDATAVFKVSDNGGSLTVDGSVGAVQSGTWTIQPGNTANTTAWLVTGTGGTFPVTDSGGSLTVDNGGTFAVQAAQSGTWNVGTVTTVTTVATVATVATVSAVTAITNALPAGTNLLGRVASSDETSTVYNGTTALTPKFAAIAASGSGNNTLVAAVSSKKIRVLAYNLIGNGAVNAKFQSGASGTDLTGLKYIAAAGGGICAPYNPVGWFETAANTLLNLNLSGATAVGGELVYVEV